MDSRKKIKIKLSGTYGYYKTDLDASAFTDEKDFTVKNNNGQLGAALQYTHSAGNIHLNYFFNYGQELPRRFNIP